MRLRSFLDQGFPCHKEQRNKSSHQGKYGPSDGWELALSISPNREKTCGNSIYSTNSFKIMQTDLLVKIVLLEFFYHEEWISHRFLIYFLNIERQVHILCNWAKTTTGGGLPSNTHAWNGTSVTLHRLRSHKLEAMLVHGMGRVDHSPVYVELTLLPFFIIIISLTLI